MGLNRQSDNLYVKQVVRKLTVAAPSSDLVNAYLAEIAKAYGVAWSLPTLPGGNDAGGGKKASQASLPVFCMYAVNFRAAMGVTGTCN
jgi:hypothetical protein